MAMMPFDITTHNNIDSAKFWITKAQNMLDSYVLDEASKCLEEARLQLYKSPAMKAIREKEEQDEQYIKDVPRKK